jgi:hypothetical protein
MSTAVTSGTTTTPGLGEPTPLRERLDDLARSYARRGDLGSALMTTWGVQMHRLEETVWESGLQLAVDPHAELAAIGEAVARALEAAADHAQDDLSAHDVVQLAREAMIGALDEVLHEAVLDGFMRLDHLVHLVPTQGRRNGHAADRLEERTAEQLVVELLGAAGDCMAVAHELVVEEEVAAAIRMARQADVATFEAFLVAAASLAGDDELGSVQMRWDLARDLAPGEADVESGTTGVAAAVARQRHQLLALLGSAEQAVLGQTFETPPGS